jgi:hypothetical protein
MHIYVFGSVCRGEIDHTSDVDLLALVNGSDIRFDKKLYSIYSYERICEIWEEGNPFAWHLALESKPIFLVDGNDFLATLGKPNPYKKCLSDCEKFITLYDQARASLLGGKSSRVFDLSTVFLSVRNIATCYSLGVGIQPDFSRHSALRIKDCPIQISNEAYKVFEAARILSTRGQGSDIGACDTERAIASLDAIGTWMNLLLAKARENERIQ